MKLSTLLKRNGKEYEIVAYKPRNTNIYELYDFEERKQFEVLEPELWDNYEIVDIPRIEA